VCGSWREIDGVRQAKYVFDETFTYSGEDAVAEMLNREKFNSGTPTKLIASGIFEGFRYDCTEKYDDIHMTYKLFASSSKVVVSGVPLYICTRHQQNNSAGTVQNETIPQGQIEEYLSRECRVEGTRTIEVASGRIVKAVLPVHVFGDLCDMEQLMQLAEAYHLIVIEDATESLGSTFRKGAYAGRASGTIGHAGVYSFNGNKIITTGGGGMVVSNMEGAVCHMRYLSQQAKDNALYFIHEESGYNYRMTNIQAALGLAQLEQLPQFLEMKRRNYAVYCERLTDCSYGQLLPFDSGESSNHWFYSFALREPNTAKRDRLIRYLNDCGIQARPIWKLNHTQTPFRRFRALDCRNAEYFYDRVVNLPCSTHLTQEQLNRVCQALLTFAG